MENVILALRNIGRNRRRSIVTMLAVALSCGGLALFGGYVSWSFCGVEIQTVGSYGHLQIYKRGFYDNGGGNPTAYALDNYEEIKKLLLEDPVIGPRLELVTGQIVFSGLVSSSRTRMSSTFIGLGVVPSDDDRLWQWNPYGVTPASVLKSNAHLFSDGPELSDDDAEGGSLGIGVGRILKLDRAAEPPPKVSSDVRPTQPLPEGVDLDFLTGQSTPTPESGRSTVELLVSPPEGGIPNVTSLGVRKLMPRATKEFDDQLIKLPLRHASELLFPDKPLHVTTVLVLLKQTADTDLVAARVGELIGQRGLDLEFRTWIEIRPFYLQVRRLLSIIFAFVFILMATLVAFTIYNTQSAGIVERLGELGTLRALGVNRWGIWRMLVLEGCFLGLFGGLLGVVLAIAGDLVFRASEIVYVPPGVSFFAKVEVLVIRQPQVLLIAFASSVLCAVLSSAFPARRAAFTPIVDALRHA